MDQEADRRPIFSTLCASALSHLLARAHLHTLRKFMVCFVHKLEQGLNVSEGVDREILVVISSDDCGAGSNNFVSITRTRSYSSSL